MRTESEVRFPLELRIADTDERIIEGIVVPYNETTFLTSDPAGERFLPGSLNRTIKERGTTIRLFRSHDHDKAIGRPVAWDARDERGAWARFYIPRTPRCDEALLEVREGLLDAMSIGFQALKERRGPDGAREIVEAYLGEVSLAPIGAYGGARVLASRTPTMPVIPPMPEVDLSPIPAIVRY